MTDRREMELVHEHLNRFREVTIESLLRVPVGEFHFRPNNQLRTLGEQFLHIGQVEEYYVAGLFLDKWDFAMFQRPTPPYSQESLTSELARIRELTNRALNSCSEEKWKSVPSVPGIPVQWTVISWLWYLVEHEVHHRAQIGLYLLELGIESPFFAMSMAGGFRPDKRK